MNEEKQPVVLDMRHLHEPVHRRSVDFVFPIEEAEAMQAKAEKLGGFSVKILAVAGEPYRTINSHERGAVTQSPVYEVPEGRVIISAVNTGNPDNPTNLEDLYK